MKEMGNPFQEETGELLTLDTKIIAHPSAADMVAIHFEKGHMHFKEFMKSLETGEENKLYTPIRGTRWTSFDQNQKPASADLKQKVLKEDYRLFSKLFISCQSRVWPTGILSTWESVFPCFIKWQRKTSQLSEVTACYNSWDPCFISRHRTRCQCHYHRRFSFSEFTST